ncbi:cytidylyltransferase domain-containing protein [Kordiimonas pumila]|uniref:Cytidylyltransferase domain-containing protein n=1 Tax=Kordiimonas pumila TaxID=2161677 RepID=A0ABV7DAU2_9PROT|nr:glycosyltransferase family protein [Kordiimonas pumila]
MSEKIVCIVQARRRSSRLPDKILKPLGDKPALAHVLKRCLAIPSVHSVVCAGIDDPFEAPVYEIAQQAGAKIFKGSENDVLSRYYGAAKIEEAQWVMRVTSDCPLFDPDVAENLIQGTLASGCTFGANADWPHGLDCELFSFDLLEQAYKNATLDGEREHVTLWMKRQTGLKMFHHFAPKGRPLGHQYRWVLDYPEDYQFLVEIYNRLGKGAAKARWQDIITLLDKEPALQTINEKCTAIWATENQKIHQDLK